MLLLSASISFCLPLLLAVTCGGRCTSAHFGLHSTPQHSRTQHRQHIRCGVSAVSMRTRCALCIVHCVHCGAMTRTMRMPSPLLRSVLTNHTTTAQHRQQHSSISDAYSTSTVS